MTFCHFSRSVAKLSDSHRLAEVMCSIEEFSKKQRGPVNGPVELDPEYQVIVNANSLTVDIDNEISK